MSQGEKALNFAREAHRQTVTALGQCSAFQMLDATEPDSRNELLAAMETGNLLSTTLLSLKHVLWRLRRELETKDEPAKVAEEEAHV